MKKLKEIPVIIKEGQDPIKIAVNHTHCPICKKALDNNWRCIKCGIQLFFRT